MYNTVYFEISGICNANCPWCATGNKTIKEYPSKFIDFQQFQNAIDKLIESNLIDSNTVISLYNKGEPTLHPKFLEILTFLYNKNIKYAISTNGSKYIEIPDDIKKNLISLRISMPGFSQKSYDRIHGFKFSQIVQNLDNWITNCTPEKIELCYHIYQFNTDEILLAKNFCKEKKITFLGFYAWIVDFQLSIAYLDGTIEKSILQKASKDLMLFYIDDLIEKCPPNYTCPEYSNLAIDEFCNVLTCCGVLKNCPDYSIGSLFYLSRDEIEYKKRVQDVCKECLRSRRAYWVHNLYPPISEKN